MDGSEIAIAMGRVEAETDDADDSSETSSSQSLRATAFTLNGSTWEFENPVSLVLAAARQLGMAIGRDAKHLWIADEALLDEYDEDQAAALTNVPDAPLSDEVANHYADVFAQRRKSVFVKPAEPLVAIAPSALPTPSETMAEAGKAELERRARLAAAAPPPTAAAASSTPTAAPATASPPGARSNSSNATVSSKDRRAHQKKERRRKRLNLREARLSGVTERYTEELAYIDVDAPLAPAPSPSKPNSPDESISPTPHSPKPTVWPTELPIEILVPPMARSLGSLPRIDSASIGLDQLERLANEAEGASAENNNPFGGGGGGAPAAASPTLSRRQLQQQDKHLHQQLSPPAEGGLSSGSVAVPELVLLADDEGDVVNDEGDWGQGGSSFAIGDRVEVDFDDEGWFAGHVESAKPSEERPGYLVYTVKLDDGETADDVEGSEIRAFEEPQKKERRSGADGGADGNGGGGEGGGSSDASHSGSQEGKPGYANTRSDALSGFDALSDAGGRAREVSELDVAEEAVPQMQCRVSSGNGSSGLEWSFLSEDELNWVPPTAKALEALRAQNRCVSPP